MKHFKNKISFLSSILLFMIFFGAIPAKATLPPIEECVVEFNGILDFGRIQKMLKGQLITSISNNFTNVVIMGEDGCEIHARIVTETDENKYHGQRKFGIADVRAIKGCTKKIVDPVIFQSRIKLFKKAATTIPHLTESLSGGAWVTQIEYLGTQTDNVNFMFHGSNGMLIGLQIQQD